MSKSLQQILSDPTADWSRATPGAEEAISQLISRCGSDLPIEYLALLRYSNGGEGLLSINPGWFQIWPAENVFEFNDGYEVGEYLPGYLGFGSNGGGEMLAFRKVDASPWPVYMVPLVGMCEEDCVEVAPDFITFVAAFGRDST